MRHLVYKTIQNNFLMNETRPDSLSHRSLFPVLASCENTWHTSTEKHCYCFNKNKFTVFLNYFSSVTINFNLYTMFMLDHVMSTAVITIWSPDQLQPEQWLRWPCLLLQYPAAKRFQELLRFWLAVVTANTPQNVFDVVQWRTVYNIRCKMRM